LAAYFILIYFLLESLEWGNFLLWKRKTPPFYLVVESQAIRIVVGKAHFRFILEIEFCMQSLFLILSE